MNRSKRISLVNILVVVALAMMLFPPWSSATYYYADDSFQGIPSQEHEYFSGYFFVGSETSVSACPSYVASSDSQSTSCGCYRIEWTMNLEVLLVQLLSLALFYIGVLCLDRRRCQIV